MFVGQIWIREAQWFTVFRNMEMMVDGIYSGVTYIFLLFSMDCDKANGSDFQEAVLKIPRKPKTLHLYSMGLWSRFYSYSLAFFTIKSTRINPRMWNQ